MWCGPTRTIEWLAVAGLLLVLASCEHIPGLHQALLADHDPAAHRPDPSSHYVVHCPDVLSFLIDGRPEWCGERAVGSDGRAWLGAHVGMRVDGLTVSELTAAVAHQIGVAPDKIHVLVSGYNSQQIYLFGEVQGLQQAVAYRGPETVLDLLQRAGGITPGAAPRDVRVVRAHVADGKKPEVFYVDLAAIVLRHDQQSNITVEPFDKVYIGQTRQSKLSKCLPPWLRAVYESVWDMRKRPERVPD
jgi:protein involved in polysaccharide export with SLBB domain